MKYWRPHKSKQRLVTHDADQCEGQPCPVHNVSDHHMKDWPQLYRMDRGITERICPCGIGHPDPDDAAYNMRIGQEWKTVHGCCGHCSPDKKDWPKTI